MAHFAKLGINGKVIKVHTLDNDKLLDANNVENERVGAEELERIHGWPAELWIQTSYNTSANTHRNGGTPLRGNYAGIGFTWDEVNEIFWPKQPYASWIKDITTSSWKAPIEEPSITSYTIDDVTKNYKIYWDENLHQTNSAKGWKAEDREIPHNTHTWTDGSWVAD
jgi:hypothetical protein